MESFTALKVWSHRHGIADGFLVLFIPFYGFMASLVLGFLWAVLVIVIRFPLKYQWLVTGQLQKMPISQLWDRLSLAPGMWDFFFPPWEMNIQRQKLQYLIVVFAKSDSFFQCLSLSLSAERIPFSLPSYDDGQEMLLDGVKISLLAQGMEWTLKNWGGFEAAVEHFSSTRRICYRNHILLHLQWPQRPPTPFCRTKYSRICWAPVAMAAFSSQQKMLWQLLSWRPLLLRGESWISKSHWYPAIILAAKLFPHLAEAEQESVLWIGVTGLGSIFSRAVTRSRVFLQL